MLVKDYSTVGKDIVVEECQVQNVTHESFMIDK